MDCKYLNVGMTCREDAEDLIRECLTDGWHVGKIEHDSLK